MCEHGNQVHVLRQTLASPCYRVARGHNADIQPTLTSVSTTLLTAEQACQIQSNGKMAWILVFRCIELLGMAVACYLPCGPLRFDFHICESLPLPRLGHRTDRPANFQRSCVAKSHRACRITDNSQPGEPDASTGHKRGSRKWTGCSLISITTYLWA